MDRLLRLGAGGMPGMQQGGGNTDAPTVDTAEQVYISSLALLKVSLQLHFFINVLINFSITCIKFELITHYPPKYQNKVPYFCRC